MVVCVHLPYLELIVAAHESAASSSAHARRAIALDMRRAAWRCWGALWPSLPSRAANSVWERSPGQPKPVA
jgi:hypothetical protein